MAIAGAKRREVVVGTPKEVVMQPDPTTIIETLSIAEPLIGLYDAPDAAPFAPLVEPAAARECVFASYRHWREGRTLQLTK
jgi:hypothetical protein